MEEEQDYVPRSVSLADFLVVLSGFFVNIVRAVEMLASEILDLAVYNANRKTKVSKVWEQFTSDLEMNCNALYVGDILSFMRDFLQGCGYQIEGTIEVVPYDTDEEFENDPPLNYNEYDGYAPKQDQID